MFTACGSGDQSGDKTNDTEDTVYHTVVLDAGRRFIPYGETEATGPTVTIQVKHGDHLPIKYQHIKPATGFNNFNCWKLSSSFSINDVDLIRWLSTYKIEGDLLLFAAWLS